MKCKDKVLAMAAKLSLDTAIKACGRASIFDCYQPKEPKDLLNKIKE